MKKFFLSGLCVLFSALSFAQTWEELHKQGLAFEEKGSYKEATPIREKEIVAARKEFGEEHINYANSLLSLGTCYSNTDQYEKAEIQETRFKDTSDYYFVYLQWAILFFLLWLLLKSTFLSNALQD